jgi:hypothetical protein
VLYVANGQSTSLSAFTISSAGALTNVAPISSSGGESGLAIVHQQ